MREGCERGQRGLNYFKAVAGDDANKGEEGDEGAGVQPTQEAGYPSLQPQFFHL